MNEKTIAELIEKDTPVKPWINNSSRTDFVICHCPRCNEVVGTIMGEDDYGDRLKYCQNCGQKIDWSE